MGTTERKIKYTDNDPNHKFVMWMNILEYKLGCIDKFLYKLTKETEVVEEILEDTWPLSISRMQRDQLNNNEFQKKLKLSMKRHPEKYTKKEINDVELIHEHDRVLVPKGS